MVDPITESTTTYKMTPAELQEAENHSCQGENTGTLLGYQVVKRTREHKRPDGRLLQVEELSAPALGCYPLYKKMTSFRDGAIAGTNETTVTAVKVGAIDKAQLDIPSGYIERSPSEVLTMLAAKQGRKCTTCETNGFPLLDGAYRLRQ